MMKYLRVLSPLVRIPLRYPRSIAFFIPSTPRPNSKAAAIVDELCEAGVRRDSIWTQGYDDVSALERVARFALRLPLALFTVGAIMRRTTRLDSTDLQIVMGYFFFRRFVSRGGGVMPIIISDTSPDLHMLWSASHAVGIDVFYWQDDYHHTWPLPFKVKVAAILNQVGYTAVYQSSPETLTLRRPTSAPKPIRQIHSLKHVGVATNAFFVASAEQRELLSHIRSSLNVDNIQLRLHPNSGLGSENFPESWIELAPRAETIEQFARRLDLAVVGNSAVQLKLVCEGLPVLHTAGMDPHGFDLYKYCRSGFVFGAEYLTRSTIEDVARYYRDVQRRSRVHDYVTVREQDNLKPLSAVMSLSRATLDS